MDNDFYDPGDVSIDSNKSHDSSVSSADGNDSTTSSMSVLDMSINLSEFNGSRANGNKDKFARLIKSLEMLPPYPKPNYYDLYFKDKENTESAIYDATSQIDESLTNADKGDSDNAEATSEERYSRMSIEEWENMERLCRREFQDTS